MQTFNKIYARKAVRAVGALAKGIFDAQASVFESSANIYAPYYRQMSTGATIPEDSNVLATDLDEFKQGADDVQRAFQYYIEHLNQGRPFIIAGHSQGTMALIELIKTEFGTKPELRERHQKRKRLFRWKATEQLGLLRINR